MYRCRDIYNILLTLETVGFRLYQTVDNIRSVKGYDPEITQMKIKEKQLNQGADVVLWENHFVNIDFKGSCREYLK